MLSEEKVREIWDKYQYHCGCEEHRCGVVECGEFVDAARAIEEAVMTGSDGKVYMEDVTELFKILAPLNWYVDTTPESDGTMDQESMEEAARRIVESEKRLRAQYKTVQQVREEERAKCAGVLLRSVSTYDLCEAFVSDCDGYHGKCFSDACREHLRASIIAELEKEKS